MPDPDQIRTEFDPAELDRLAESIKRHGILAPLRVRWASDLGKHFIVVGERRYQAALKAGLTQVPVIVVEGAVSPKDVLESQIAENCIRTDISPIDQANAFRKYMTLADCSAKELSELLHVSQATVSRSLALLGLPEEVQDAITEGKLSPRAGRAIAQIRNPTVQKHVATKAVKESLPAEAVDRTVRQRQGVPAKATQAQPFVQFKIARGTRVVIHGRLTGREVLAALEAAVELRGPRWSRRSRASRRRRSRGRRQRSNIRYRRRDHNTSARVPARATTTPYRIPGTRRHAYHPNCSPNTHARAGTTGGPTTGRRPTP